MQCCNPGRSVGGYIAHPFAAAGSRPGGKLES
jgi:hypothetical protein